MRTIKEVARSGHPLRAGRRSAVALGCALAATVFGGSVKPPPAAITAASRPNVVVIMADDLDAALLNRMLGAGLMPNLNAHVVSRGVQFQNSFVVNPVCAPSRATFLTGQYSHNNGVRRNYDPGGGVSGLDDASTIATWLRAAGYRTSYVGKYMNGYGSADVNRDGTKSVEDIRYIPPGWHDWQALFDPTMNRMFHYAINDNGTFVVHGNAPEDYQTDVLARRAARAINRFETDDASPFFLVVMPSAPHVEVPTDFVLEQYSDVWRFTIRPAPRYEGSVTWGLAVPPSFNEADVREKPAWLQSGRPVLTETDQLYARQKYQARAASMRAVDDMVGTIVSTLKAAGEFENTVLIFTSDNGYHVGTHRLGEKLDAYEESIRVPLLVAGPGTVRRTLPQMVLNTDLAPTIADIAGASPTLAVDGRSFRPLLGDSTLVWRKRFLIEHWDAMDTHLCQQYRSTCAVLEVPSYAGLRTGTLAKYVPAQTYVEYPGGEIELYDLAADPYQLTSLHADASATRVFQRSVHAQWLAALRECRAGTCQAYEFQ